jgi:RNAse (barnase) inhibitor barstar
MTQPDNTAPEMATPDTTSRDTTLPDPANIVPDGLHPAPADPRALADGLDAGLLTLQLDAVQGRPALMQQLSHDLKLPRHFGRNWDALYDILADPEYMEPCVIHLVGWSDFLVREQELAARLEGVLLDAQTALADSDIPLWVLV